MTARARLATVTSSEPPRIIYGPVHRMVNGPITACGLNLPSDKLAVPSDPWWADGPRCGDCETS